MKIHKPNQQYWGYGADIFNKSYGGYVHQFCIFSLKKVTKQYLVCLRKQTIKWKTMGYLAVHIWIAFRNALLYESARWWRHQMETFSALLATGEFPSQRPVMRNFDVSFDLPLNKRLSKQSRRRWLERRSRSLWCHCNEMLRSWQIHLWSTGYTHLDAFTQLKQHCNTVM